MGRRLETKQPHVPRGKGKAGTLRQDLKRTGVKFDANKSRHELLPWLALDCVAVVLRDGAHKYDEHNWRKGIHWSRLLRAAIGHTSRFLIGEIYDRETKLPHLAHAACCILFVLEYYLVTRVTKEYNWADNRYQLDQRVLDDYSTMDSFRDPDTRRGL